MPVGQTESLQLKFIHFTLNSRAAKMSTTRGASGSGAPQASINSSRGDSVSSHREKSSSRRSTAEKSRSSSRSRSSSKKSPAQRSRDERRSAAYAAEKNDSKKDESKDKAVKTAEVAVDATKNNSTPSGKRKGSEVISHSGLTPQNKTMNTGMFIFIFSNIPQICWLQ